MTPEEMKSRIREIEARLGNSQHLPFRVQMQLRGERDHLIRELGPITNHKRR